MKKPADNHRDYTTETCALCKGKKLMKRKITIELLTLPADCAGI
ncbi:MAG: hypothetical protein QM500_15535 [Methylococcales bacterium]